MRAVTRRALLAAGLAIPLTAGGSQAQTESQGVPKPNSLGPSVPPEVFDPTGNWPLAQGDLRSTRVARGSSITAANVESLRIAWTFPVTASTGYGGMTATPIVIGETVYLQDMRSNIFALERSTGAPRWEHRYEIGCVGPNGVAVGYGMVFAGLGDTAEVVALDAASGAERWRVRLSNNPGEGIDMAPAVYDSTVYISTVAGNLSSFNRGGAKGVLFALDAATGETLWQFDTTTNDLWGSPRVNSGGGLWYPPSFDTRGDIYFGVGNAAPWPGTTLFPNGGSRVSPNDYASSMVALNRETGAVRWHYNAAPHDLFDHDFQNSPVLIGEATEEGRQALAIGSGKTGTVVAVDLMSGSVVWKAKVGEHTESTVPELSATPVSILPGAWGGVLTPLAATETTVFVPVVNQPTTYTATGVDKMSMFDFTQATGEIVALDTKTGIQKWRTQLPSPALGGATLVNDVVITAGMDGIVRFVHAETGELVHEKTADAGINACPAISGTMIIQPAAGARIRTAETPDSVSASSFPMVVAWQVDVD